MGEMDELRSVRGNINEDFVLLESRIDDCLDGDKHQQRKLASLACCTSCARQSKPFSQYAASLLTSATFEPWLQSSSSRSSNSCG